MAIDRVDETEDDAQPNNDVDDCKNFASIGLGRKVSIAYCGEGNY